MLNSFEFGNGDSFYDLSEPPRLTTEEKKNTVEVWKAIVSVQQHFNDISLRIRGLFVTLILALFAAIGFLADKDLKFTLYGLTAHCVLLVPIGGVIGALLFYFIDRYWYHRLLVGSVKQGLFIENRYRFEMPEIALTEAIGANSPIRLKRRLTRWLARCIVTDEPYKITGQIHSTAKIELFYKPIIWMFLIAFAMMLLNGAVLLEKETLLDVGLRKISSLDWPRHSTPKPPEK